MASEGIEDVRSRLPELRRLLVASMADEQRLYQRYTEASHEADRWRSRAALAVSRGMDDLAKAALERSGELEARASEHYLQYLDQKSRVEEMKARLQRLESGVFSIPSAARASSEQARLERTAARLRRVEDRASEERARLAALAELERDEVAERLAVLEREDRLERQLADLKSKLGIGGQGSGDRETG